jgi:hypothetical protein
MDNRLEAHYQNRIYYFQLLDKKPGEVSITMYNTPYSFVSAGERWENGKFNKMNMADGLIAAVMVAAGVV